jgi:hypothetical protein
MTDTSITDAGNVTPLPVKAKRCDTTAALRQRRSRAKRKRVTPVPAAVIAQIAQPGKPNRIKADVTVSYPKTYAADVTAVTLPRRTNYALVIIAYGFFALGIGINIWNATTGGTLTDMALPAALGVLAAAVVFFLPTWALTLPIGRQVLAWALTVMSDDHVKPSLAKLLGNQLCGFTLVLDAQYPLSSFRHPPSPLPNAAGSRCNQARLQPDILGRSSRDVNC